MSTEPRAPLDDPALLAYDRLDVLLWVADIDAWVFVWANRSALKFWNAPTVRALMERKFTASPTARTLHFHLRERLRKEPFVRIDQTVFPDGRAPVRLAMCLSIHPLPGGREGLLVEATPLPLKDPEVLRRVDAIKYAPLAVTTHAMDGETLSANALARATFGDWFSFTDLFVQRALGPTFLARLANDEAVSEDVELSTGMDRRWFAIEARRIVDPERGEPAILLAAHDITERKLAERAKDELISAVSHELRTPLTAISGSLELLASGAIDLDRNLTKELVGIARENTQRLSRLVGDLLDVQRIAAGAIVLRRERTAIRDLVERTTHRHRAQAALAGVSIHTHVEEDITCLVDGERIEQVLSNVLSNALKHSRAGQDIHVRARRHAGMLRISVADEGPGIPETFRSRIFSLFSQADSSDGRPVGGAGLGLYIAKCLVEKHGGTIGYENRPSGGAEVFFHLPAEVPPPEQAA